MGLNLNDARTGSMSVEKKGTSFNTVDVTSKGLLPPGHIRWGMLYLNPASGKFEIDKNMVEKHIEELKNQLKAKEHSLLAWIQTWNVYADKFFTTNFGQPANCFGRDHVENMLTMHEYIQKQVFSGINNLDFVNSNASVTSPKTPSKIVVPTPHQPNSVVDFLRQEIKRRFQIQDIPEGYFLFPAELGGLDLRNAFVELIQVRDGVRETPQELLAKFKVAERSAYVHGKQQFELRHRRGGPSTGASEPFISWEEYTNYRHIINDGSIRLSLNSVYLQLLTVPQTESVAWDEKDGIMSALNALSGSGSRELQGILCDHWAMTGYWQWVVNLYGPELIKRFGGLRIVDEKLLPMGMINLFKSGRVAWKE